MKRDEREMILNDISTGIMNANTILTSNEFNNVNEIFYLLRREYKLYSGVNTSRETKVKMLLKIIDIVINQKDEDIDYVFYKQYKKHFEKELAKIKGI